MKVLLINPWQSDVFPSPSLGYLQATLKEAEVDVKARDLDEAMYLNGGNLFYTFEQNIKTLQLWTRLINAA
jgi:hypothetical protein